MPVWLRHVRTKKRRLPLVMLKIKCVPPRVFPSADLFISSHILALWFFFGSNDSFHTASNSNLVQYLICFEEAKTAAEARESPENNQMGFSLDDLSLQTIIQFFFSSTRFNALPPMLLDRICHIMAQMFYIYAYCVCGGGWKLRELCICYWS